MIDPTETRGRKAHSVTRRGRDARSQRVGLVALAGLLTLALVGCGPDARADGENEGEDRASSRVINVEVRELERGPFTEITRITGTVQASQDVTVSAEESGVIRELLVERGGAVRAGQPLARIDAALLEAQVREAEARAGLARETWERRKRLFEEDGVGSELAYLEARYQAEQAEASLENLRARLERTVIRAPVTGLLEDRLVEVGTMVSAGTPVARVVQVDPVKITGGVPERFAAEISRGAPARVTFDVLRDEEFEADLSFVGATVNPRNRTFPVELLLPNPGRVVKPEMVANIELTRRELEDVLVIPQDAVVRVEDGFVAFVVVERDGESVAEVRPLTLGSSQRNRVVVQEGLEADDRLIVVGQQQVAHGDRVQVVEARRGGGNG